MRVDRFALAAVALVASSAVASCSTTKVTPSNNSGVTTAQ